MIYALLSVLILVMLAAAVFALEHKKLVFGVIAAGLVSLIASIIFVLLAAPDVAMTEAAIGSGLSTVMFFYVLNKVRGGLMVKKLFALLLIAGFGLLFYQMERGRKKNTELNKTAAHYVEKGPKETGSANLVTAVVVTYRGLDTLGEVTILFVAASIIGFVLKNRRVAGSYLSKKNTSELLRTGSAFLVPLIFLMGVYVFVNGHLSPGGGFQGGAIIASGTVLLFLADPRVKAGRTIIGVVEALSGVSYVALGVAGLFLAGGFLDNRLWSLGQVGMVVSAGAIPVIYSLIGLKVGSELSAVLYNLKDAKE